MYKIGKSSCDFELEEAIFDDLKKSGIDAIEVSLPQHKYKDFNYKAARAVADKLGIELWSFHLQFAPFEYVNISSPDKLLRNQSIALLTEQICRGADIGIDKFIIHPSGEPIDESVRDEHMKCSMDSLDKLAELAYRLGATIAVENLPRTCLGNCADDMLKLLSANDKLRVCFDVNHLLNDTHKNFVEKVGDKIITLHISDYDFADERHWLPGEGKIDWLELMDLLKKCNYSGVFMYEVAFNDQKTIVRERPLTATDFYNNAKTLFNGETPISIGKPIV